MRPFAVTLLAALIATPAVAQNAVTLDQDVIYYDVRGLTEPAIAESLHRDAPREIDGFQGQADFMFSWTYNYDEAGKQQNGQPLCEVTNARVKIEIDVTLPRHRTIRRAPDDVEQTWKRFAQALELHELNHARDFARIGSQIPEALNGIRGSCATIEDLANAKGMEYVDLAQKAADDYDARTNHGETEGTFFPGI